MQSRYRKGATLSTDLELLSSGWGLIEGPRVDANDNFYFSDVPNGGVRLRRPSGEIEVVIPKRRGVGGMVFHENGGLVVGGRNIQIVKDGDSRILFDPGFPGFNDLHTDAAGRIYVGSLRSDPFSDAKDRQAGELWRLELNGDATQIYDGVQLTNGIGFSPDGMTLYHSDSVPGRVWMSDVEGDSVVNKRSFVEEHGAIPDGLAVDIQGGVWVALAQGGRVQRYLPDGTPDVSISIPDPMVTSLCFGGSDMRDLYVVTGGATDLGGCIYKTRSEIAGLSTPKAKV